jgi:hypothetical protein
MFEKIIAGILIGVLLSAISYITILKIKNGDRSDTGPL